MKMEKLITEKAEKCNLVKTRSIDNGHDCWGKYEFITENYVVIKGVEHRVCSEWFIEHNGTDVIRIFRE